MDLYRLYSVQAAIINVKAGDDMTQYLSSSYCFVKPILGIRMEVGRRGGGGEEIAGNYRKFLIFLKRKQGNRRRCH
jgi:hypothetical protein